MAEVYCFNLPEDMRGRIAALCARYRIRMVEVGPEKHRLTIRELTAGFPGKNTEKAFEESLLLMDHLDQYQFNGFLDDLKKCTPPFQCLKAIVTGSNRKWTAEQLIEELKAEKAAFEQRRAQAQAKTES